MAFLASVYKGDSSFLPEVSKGNGSKEAEEKAAQEKLIRHKLCSTSRSLSGPIFHFMSLFSPVITRITVKDRKDIVYSPFSILSLLSCLRVGMTDEGKKLIDGSGIGIENDFPEKFKAAHAFFNFFPEEVVNINGLFCQNDNFHAKYRKIAKDRFKTRVFTETFPNPGSTNLNEFFKFRSAGKIRMVVKKVNKNVKFLAVSALRYETDWDIPFQKSNSRKGYRFNYFKREKGRHKCEMMCEYDRNILYGDHEHEGLKFSTCTLPCREEDFSIIFVKTDGLDRSNFTKFGELLIGSGPQFINELRSQQSNRELDTLMIPKFSAESTIELREIMDQLKLGGLYESEVMSSAYEKEESKSKIDQILVKCMIRMDEKGSLEDSASPSMGILRHGSFAKPAHRYQFVLDQPFYCFVVHNIANIVMVCCAIEKPVLKK